MLERREPKTVVLLCFLTCGLYLIYWYAKIYEELSFLTGETPTGRDYWHDLPLVIVTCGLYGIWVDYRISLALWNHEVRHGFLQPRDTAVPVVLLDICGYMSLFTNFISSAIHQDRLNQIAEHHARMRGLYAPPDERRL